MKFLKSFMGHEHLDSRQRGEGQAGFPGTYPAQFGGLNAGYVDYLVGLATAPESTIEIRVAKPAKFLSARERANPFLAAQGPQGLVRNVFGFILGSFVDRSGISRR